MTIGGVPPQLINHGLVSSGVDITLCSSLFYSEVSAQVATSEVDACLLPAGPFSAAALVSQGAQAGESFAGCGNMSRAARSEFVLMWVCAARF